MVVKLICAASILAGCFTWYGWTSGSASVLASQNHSVSLTIVSPSGPTTTVNYSYCSNNALTVAQGIAAAIRSTGSGYQASAAGNAASAKVTVTNSNPGIDIPSITSTPGSGCNFPVFNLGTVPGTSDIDSVVSID